jgi:hypothetical protein
MSNGYGEEDFKNGSSPNASARPRNSCERADHIPNRSGRMPLPQLVTQQQIQVT